MIRKVYRLRRLWFYYIPLSSTFSVETLRRISSYNEAKYFAVEVEVLQKQNRGTTDEIRGRECADYIREFCAEQRALVAEYNKEEPPNGGMEDYSDIIFTNPS